MMTSIMSLMSDQFETAPGMSSEKVAEKLKYFHILLHILRIDPL